MSGHDSTVRDSGPSVLVQTEDGTNRPAVGDNDVAGVELFRWLFRFFYSKTVGLILILLMALLAVLGSVIMQAGPGTYDDPAKLESFLAAARENYGGWAPILDALGLFHVFTSLVFYAVVIPAAVSAAVWVVLWLAL